MKKSFVVLVSWLAVSACGNAPTVPVPQCVPGMSAECTCTSGAKGAQVCDSSGAFDPCVCAGGSGGGSAGGSAGGVAGGTGGVGGGSAGGRAGGSGGGAHAGGAGGSSGGGTAGGGTVIGPDGGCAVIDPEFCDGRDNDCNGLVDDKEVCADPAVTNASPFTAGVYFLGTTAEGSCGADALQRFWPTQALGYSVGFDCYDDWFIFRPSDQTIFYSATFSGIHRNIDGGVDPVQPTPPCNDSVRQVFGFDGTGTLHYQCSDTVRRGNGDLVAQQVQSLVGVFTDGRVLVTRAATGSSGSDYVVLSSAGVELSRSSLGSSFSGSLTVDPTGVTFAGNTAYVTFKRDYGQGLHEVVVYRVDASSQWARVRRAPVEGYGYWRLALSDGTVFVRENDPLTTFDQQIKAYLPDGGVSLAWREANASTVRAHIGDQLLVGPP